jgi:hypothetical protein
MFSLTITGADSLKGRYQVGRSLSKSASAAPDIVDPAPKQDDAEDCPHHSTDHPPASKLSIKVLNRRRIAFPLGMGLDAGSPWYRFVLDVAVMGIVYGSSINDASSTADGDAEDG